MYADEYTKGAVGNVSDQGEQEKSMQVICEVRSSTYQKVAALLISLIVGTIGVWGLASVIYPSRFPSADDFAHMPIEERCFMGAMLCGVVMLAFYVWRSTVCFRLIADDNGITQTNGFRHDQVKWADVHSYTIEHTPGTMFTYQPVLRDVEARVIFRPIGMSIRPTSRTVFERARFWQYVINRIDERRGTWR